MSEVLNLNKIAFRKAEYKRQNLWILSMDGIEAWQATSANKPQMTTGDSMQVNFLSTYSMYSGTRGKWEPIDITLNDAIDPSASKALYNLVQAQWDFQTGRVGSKAQYAKEIQLKLLAPGNGMGSPDGGNTFDGTIDSTAVIETWTLNNVFFTNINFNATNLNYDDTARQTVSFTLNYDNATVA